MTQISAENRERNGQRPHCYRVAGCQRRLSAAAAALGLAVGDRQENAMAVASDPCLFVLRPARAEAGLNVTPVRSRRNYGVQRRRLFDECTSRGLRERGSNAIEGFWDAQPVASPQPGYGVGPPTSCGGYGRRARRQTP